MLPWSVSRTLRMFQTKRYPLLRCLQCENLSSHAFHPVGCRLVRTQLLYFALNAEHICLDLGLEYAVGCGDCVHTATSSEEVVAAENISLSTYLSSFRGYM